MLRCGLLVVAGLCLSACLAPLRFGAERIERVADTGGVPTYHASGHLDRNQQGEMKAAEVMQAACPGGSPVLLSGYIMKMEILPRWLWDATFTCNDVIPLD